MKSAGNVTWVLTALLCQYLVTMVTSMDSAPQYYHQMAITTETYNILRDEGLLSIDIEITPCDTDEDCKRVLPNLEKALGKRSSIPQAPFCVPVDIKNTKTLTGNASGHCTCGSGNCVSYTLEFGRDTPFYYCGLCSHMGSQCQNGTCAHEMAECKDDYCQCKRDGNFYEFNYCQIPYIAYETSLQACIILCIVIVGLLILSSIYTASGIRPWWRNRQLSEGVPESSTSEDLPPDYEEVMDILPSYHDALQMGQEEEDDHVENDTVRNSENNDEGSSIVPSPSETPQRNDMESERANVEMVHSTTISSPTESSFSSTDSSNQEVSLNEQQQPSIPLLLQRRSSSLPNVHESISNTRHQPIELPLHQSSHLQTHC